MSEKDWAKFGFPPLRLTLAELRELVAAAGPEAQLSSDGETTVPAEELIAEGRNWTADAVVTTPRLKLELAGDRAQLSFNNHSAMVADQLVTKLAKRQTDLLGVLLPLFLAVAIATPLMLQGFRPHIVSLSAIAGILIGAVAKLIRSRKSQPQSEPLTDAQHRWRTTFESSELNFTALGELAHDVGETASLEFSQDNAAPTIVLRGDGIELTLRAGVGEIVYDDATAHMQDFYNQVRNHRRTLHWLTHDDFAIFAGMLLPVAAIALAPTAFEVNVALIAIVPWLAYLQWVLHNQRKRWSVVVDSDSR
ncbi:MAG: hypothetical protein GY811_22100 [Myxococcales bacterium]|nr:hypothetical protein [Myxococcales bacterium]